MRTYTTLPVRDHIILIDESSKNDREINIIFFASTSLRYPITTHLLALLIGESIQPSISLEVVIVLTHGLLTHFENEVNPNLDVEFPSMKSQNIFIRIG